MKKLGISILMVLFLTTSGWAKILTNEDVPPAKKSPAGIDKLSRTDPLVMAIGEITSDSFDFFSESSRVKGAKTGKGNGNGYGNGKGNGVPNDNPAPVPEPGTLLLLGVGVIGFVAFRKFKNFA